MQDKDTGISIRFVQQYEAAKDLTISEAEVRHWNAMIAKHNLDARLKFIMQAPDAQALLSGQPPPAPPRPQEPSEPA